MIGQTISHYKILEKLGEGGMGVVYKAEDTKLDRTVAIKFLPRHISVSSEERERFKIEAKASAALNHPNITQIYAIEETNNEMFISMELIEGVELKEKIKSGSLAIGEAIDLAIQIAEGLEAAHKKRIVHRDIKSQNIMITDNGKVKIMDFGLAKIGKGAQVTKIGSTIGTIAYMSPEQAKGEELDQRTDIWSFGVVLYEMLTGKLPFNGDYEQAVIYSILNGEPEFENNSPSELNSIILKALSKDPDKRYQTAGELLSDLHSVSNGLSLKFKNKTRIPKTVFITSGILLILIIVALVFKNSFTSIEPQNISIAVLPFSDLSPTKDQAYLGDGLAEQLRNNLTKIVSLRVTAKTSSFALRDKNLSVQDIAEKLNVSKVLEGSVQKIGDKVRITANLIDASNGYQIWSEAYNRNMNDIFAIQDEIGESVVNALKIKLFGTNTLPEKKKIDPQAYNYCLQGNYFHDLRGKENLEKSIFYYEQALKIDSTYATAWNGLSSAYSSCANFGYGPVNENNKIAMRYAKRAIELEPTLAEAYSTIGWIMRIYYWDWAGADSAYQFALKLDPGNQNIVSGAAALASTLGRFDEALALDQKATELNPLSLASYLNLVLHAYSAGEFELAIRSAKKVIEMNPKFPGVHMMLGQVYLVQIKNKEASEEFEKEPDELWHLYGKILLNYAEGKTKEADRYLDKFINEYKDIAAFQVAEIFAFRGDADNAFIWLEKAYKLHDSGLATIIGNPAFKDLEKDRRYFEFLKKMKLLL